MRSFFGNVGILFRGYCYIRTLGPDGLREVSENAVLNANYLRARVKEAFEVPHGGPCMHEFVASARNLRPRKEDQRDGRRASGCSISASTPRPCTSRWSCPRR